MEHQGMGGRGQKTCRVLNSQDFDEYKYLLVMLPK